ncbi:MAG TPA: hypothetical protein VNU97_16705 [Rhizomicrobium sp.]|jgi:hypothetical protein|nr:hypothetical protein [Rhizomicrobium sp.]
MRLKSSAAFLALVLSSLAAGCTDKSDFRWYDITGKGRDADLAMIDVKICDRLSPVLPNSAGSNEVQAAFRRHEFCMHRRGWEMR